MTRVPCMHCRDGEHGMSEGHSPGCRAKGCEWGERENECHGAITNRYGRTFCETHRMLHETFNPTEATNERLAELEARVAALESRP